MPKIMHAGEARNLSDNHRTELNNVLVEKHLIEIMDLITRAGCSGLYFIRNPFTGINGDVLRMVCERLRELGYTIEFNVGDDGPGRPGHDEITWKR